MIILHDHNERLDALPPTLIQGFSQDITKLLNRSWPLRPGHASQTPRGQPCGRLDYPIWQVTQNGNGPVSVTTDTNGMIKVSPPKTTEEVVARERERKARTTLLMALPEDHLAKFHKMTDTKEMWEAIKSRFGIHKGYDRFQSLLSQLEIHGVGVLHEDANQKFLKSLPFSWSQVALIMRTKQGLDTLSFDDLYNNLRVFERDVKGTTASSSSNTQNVAFASADNTSSTNDVSTAYSVSSPSVLKSQYMIGQDATQLTTEHPTNSRQTI
nr:xylulose kinase-1 [Tanacetum cinerariifolium]